MASREKPASQASAEGEQEPFGAHAAAGPLDARGAGRDDNRGGDDARADGATLERRAGEGEHDRDAADDHADGGRVGLAHALDDEQVEEHQAGGRQGDHARELAR